jgi:uncharacterized protein YjbJ (UPF0337 family)
LSAAAFHWPARRQLDAARLDRLAPARFSSHRLLSPYGNLAGQEIIAMDKNRTAGAKHEIKGALKELAGKVTGNESKELAGKAERKLGKVQRKAGEASDEIRDTAKNDD